MGFWGFASGARKASDLVFLRGSGRWIDWVNRFRLWGFRRFRAQFLALSGAQSLVSEKKWPKARRLDAKMPPTLPTHRTCEAQQRNRQRPSLGLRDS